MQIRKLIPMYNGNMERLIRAGKFSKSEEAQFRLKVVEFSKKYGVKATEDAFSVSRTTIFRWRKCLKDAHGCIDSLIPKSKKPKRLRQMKISTEIISFIRDIREKHPHIGKEKIKPLLDDYCIRRGINSISVSTIGKCIKRYNLTFNPSVYKYHNPQSGWAKRKKNYSAHVRYSPKIRAPGYIEMDTIVKFQNGIKRYILNAVDVGIRFEFSYAFKSLSSRSTLEFFKKLQSVYPIENGIHTVQTDNGHEYRGEFDKYLKKDTIKHLFIYPGCPRINGYIERANRTLQEEFVNYNLNLLFEDYAKFNLKLMEYLIFYNTKRVHRGLNNLSPIDFVLKYHPEYQMYVTQTYY